MRSSTAPFRIGQRVRVTACESYGVQQNDPLGSGLGTIMATLTISPDYYDVRLDRAAARCIVFVGNLEVLP